MGNIREVILGLGVLFELKNFIWLTLLIIGLVILFNYVYAHLERKSNKMKYLVRKDKKSMLHNLTRQLNKSDTIRRLLRKVAIKIGMFTEYSYEKNLEYATGATISSLLVSAFVIIVFVPGKQYWYITMFYFVIALLIIMLVFYVFFAMAKMNFIQKLPDTYKILNSRYISKGNILKAIHVSLADFDKVIRKEMVKIYNVLKKNDMSEIEFVLSSIDETYNDQYLTILLSLIKQAHYKGGNKMIKDQFETLTEEILIEIENRRDLTSASRSYVIMALFVPMALPALKAFNEDAIGEKATEFYASALGSKLPIAVVAAVLGYMAFLLVLERSA